MGTRLELHTILLSLMPENHKNVYFQPPPDLQMSYPAIVYKRDFANTIFASNIPYRSEKRYMATIIDKDPDSEIPDKVAKLPKCLFVRHFTADKLNHDIYNLYF